MQFQIIKAENPYRLWSYLIRVLSADMARDRRGVCHTRKAFPSAEVLRGWRVIHLGSQSIDQQVG